MGERVAVRGGLEGAQAPLTAAISDAADRAIIYQDIHAPSALLDPAGLEQAVHKQFPRRTGALPAV